MPSKETPHPLIIEGVVQENSLQQIGQNEFWLRQQLKKQGYEDVSQVSLCTYVNGEFYIDKNN